MSSYSPIYKWYETRADLLADNPILTSSGDSVAMQLWDGEFLYGRFGGCLSGSASCTLEMLTLIKQGWYVLVYLSADTDSVWVGRVFDRVGEGETGRIEFLGPIHYFNGFLRQVPRVDGIPLEVALYDLAIEMEKVNKAISGTFLPNAILSGHYPAWDPQGQDLVSLALSTKRSFQSEAALIAGASENLFYGFFPGLRRIWISKASFLDGDFNETADATPLDFQIARGIPTRSRYFQDRKTAYVTINRKTAKDRFNRVVLCGNNRINIWVAQDNDALATDPPLTVWGRREEISSDGLGQRMADRILALGSRSDEYYDVEILHDATEGSTSNLVEQGPLLPWSDRPVIKDKFGIKVIAQGAVYGASLRLGVAPSQRIQVGISNLDIKEFFQLTSFDSSPSQDQFSFEGIQPWNADEDIELPADIPDPPVGFYTGPVRESRSDDSEVVANVIPSTVFRYENFALIGTDYSGVVNGRNLTTIRTKSDRFSLVTWDPDYPYRLGILNQLELYRILRWADPLTIPFWREATTQGWRALATVYRDGQVVSFDELLKQAGSFLWTNYKVDEATVDSLVAKLRVGQFTTGDVRFLQRSTAAIPPHDIEQGFIVSPDPGYTDDPGDSWTPTTQRYEDLHFVPYSLILHLGGTMRGLITGADSSHTNANWDYLFDTYGGDGNIYSVESTFYPYEVTVALPSPLADADKYYPALSLQSNDATSTSKNVFYMTRQGAAAAIALGYFWHEILSFSSDVTTFDFDASPSLDAHNWGNYGFFTKRESLSGVAYDDTISVPFDLARMLTLYDVHAHSILGTMSQSHPKWYSGPDGYGSKVTEAEEADNLGNVNGQTGLFDTTNPSNIKLVRKKIFFTSLRPAPPALYKGDSPSATYPPPIRMRRWKVRGFDDDHATAYNAVNNQ